MSVRDLPIRPDSEQLKRQANELLRAIRAGDAHALAERAEPRGHARNDLEPALRLIEAAGGVE